MPRSTPVRALAALAGAAVVLAGVQQAAGSSPLQFRAARAAAEAASAGGVVATAAAASDAVPIADLVAARDDQAPLAPPRLAPRGGGIPVGKGMWIWQPGRAEGGDAAAIVARAQEVGLTHIYVRTGSSRQGFHGASFLEAILPLAHEAGIRVYGWDFPYLEDVGADVERALAAINYRTATGHRIDGFVPDIETGAEGTNLSAETAGTYSQLLRGAVGADYPLVACVPHPSQARIASFPYAAIIPHYDAVAPMSYWLNRQPDTDAQHAVSWLRQFGKPVIPVGQAYDGAPEGGRPGPPPADEIRRFISAAEATGASGVSFWSWQHATPEIWDAIEAAPEMTIPLDRSELDREQLVAVQTQLSSMSYWAPPTGAWDDQTIRAVRAFQADMGLLPTGQLDIATRTTLLAPLAPPLGR